MEFVKVKLVTDDDAHKYIIPVELSDQFEDWLDSFDRHGVSDYPIDFNKYRHGSSRLEFYIPKSELPE